MTKPEISSVSPFFIVHDGAAALSFYLVCVDSNSRTRTATSCFSVVLGPKAGFDVRQCIVQPGRAQQRAAGDVRGRTRLGADVGHLEI